LLEVYKKSSEEEALFTNSITLWLATEMGLPTRTLFEGLIENLLSSYQSEQFAYSGSKEAPNFMQVSYVLAESESKLSTIFAIYLVHLVSEDLQILIPDSLAPFIHVAQENLSQSNHPFARVLLLLKKSKQGLNQEDKIKVQQLLSDLVTAEMPNIDKTMALIFLTKVVVLPASDVLSVNIASRGRWGKRESELGHPFWFYKKAVKKQANIILDKSPQNKLYAHLTYDSYSKEPHKLPVEIERRFYCLERRVKPLEFDAVEVGSDWEVNASADLYVDEIRLMPSAENNYKYGILEVPLPPGAEVESSTWGIKIAGLDDEKEPKQIAEPRYTARDLSYTIPVESLNGLLVFHHLVRFSQAGTFNVPRVRYFRMYMPGDKAFEKENNPEFQKIVVHQ